MNIVTKIKILLRIKAPVEGLIKEINKMSKSGWKTTEFWLVIITNLLGVVGALKGILGDEVVTIALTVLNSIYAILRTLSKTPASPEVK